MNALFDKKGTFFDSRLSPHSAQKPLGPKEHHYKKNNNENEYKDDNDRKEDG